MTTDTSHLITPPSADDYEALRDSIFAYGQHYPILLAPDGSIIDGNLRMRACGELGLIAITAPVEVGDDELTIEAFALLHHADSDRHPIPAERDRIVLALRERGMTMRQIAAATGVSQGTVSGITRAARPGVQVEHGRRPDTMGRAQPTRKPTVDELARRDGLMVRYYRAGHSIREVAEALDIGESQIGTRLRQLGVTDVQRHVGRGPVRNPGVWRDEDMPAAALEPRWLRSRITGMAQMLNDEYREANFANVLANQATEAESAGDKDWLIEALATFNAALEKLERARRILTDDAYRDACRDTNEGVEALRHTTPRRTPLRAV